MKQNKNFFDNLDSDWGDAISDTYNNANTFIPETTILNHGKQKCIEYYKYHLDNTINAPVEFPNDVEVICSSSFESSSIPEIKNFPRELKKIETAAFSNCKLLKGELNFPQGLESIERHAFFNCEGLSGNLIIPETVRNLGSQSFTGCKGMTGKLVLPLSLEFIIEYTFGECGFSGELVIPESIKEIQRSAFFKCENLTSLKLSEGLKRIEQSAFAYCTNLSGTLYIPDSIEFIGNRSFAKCKFDKVLLPKRLKRFEEYIRGNQVFDPEIKFEFY